MFILGPIRTQYLTLKQNNSSQFPKDLTASYGSSWTATCIDKWQQQQLRSQIFSNED